MKRLLLFFFALAAIACFGLSAYGLYWMWKIKQPAIEATTDAFDKAGKWLNLADSTINELKGNLEASRAQVVLVPRENPSRAAGGAGFMESFIARSVARQVAPNLTDVQHTLAQVTEATIVANSIIESLPDESLGPIDRLNIGQVRTLQTQLDSVSRASWDLSEILAPDGDNGETPAAKSAQIAANLTQIIAMTEDFQKRLNALQQRFERIERTTLYWLKIGPTLATILLIWIMISQIIVLAYVVSSWRQ